MKKGRRYAKECRGVSLSAMILIGIAFAAACWFAVEMFAAGGEENRDRSAASGVSLVSAARSEAPKPSSALQLTVPAGDKWELLLVNYDHKLPEDFMPDLLQDDGVEMDSRIAAPFEAMRAAAKKEGLSLYASSAYRSSEAQNKLFREEVSQYTTLYPTVSEAEAVAAESVARPGYSEHGTGLAIDLNGVQDNFVQTKEYRWLLDHAEEYGFVLRYPEDKQEITHIKFEPWHFRYVGQENAEKMKQADECLEEYLDSLEKTGSLH
jgi:zinc D-Ala-D-Ala carboxypeptidase